MVNYNEEEFIRITNQSRSMAEAASIMGIHFNTHKRIAKKLGCYAPNMSGKGFTKNMPSIPISEILNGEHPYYQTYKLKNRLFRERIKENRCEKCGINEWNGKSINCELDHIDGDRTNHKIENLRIICPNCHSQTETYRSKNKNARVA